LRRTMRNVAGAAQRKQQKKNADRGQKKGSTLGKKKRVSRCGEARPLQGTCFGGGGRFTRTQRPGLGGVSRRSKREGSAPCGVKKKGKKRHRDRTQKFRKGKPGNVNLKG